MKNLITQILIFISVITSAQDYDRFTDSNNDGRSYNPYEDKMNFVPNEVLVKFKDNVQLNSGAVLKSAGTTVLYKILQNHHIAGVKKMIAK